MCIGVTPECRQMESEMIGDGQGCADEVDKVYHDTGTSDFRWPVGHFCSDGWGDGTIGSGMGSGVASTCVEIPWRILGTFFSNFSFLL